MPDRPGPDNDPVAAGRPIFLARASYRQRRLRDGLKILPVVGAVLWFIPLLWPDNATTTGAVLIHIFVIWFGLIAVSLGLSARLRRDPMADLPGTSTDSGTD